MPPYDIGLREARLGHFEEARRAFEEAAASGEARAYACLGQMASNGQGEPENPARAAELYERGANAGCATAAYSLGALYALGRGVTRDPNRAIHCYRRAAELGDVDGSFKVGIMLALGEVGPPGPEQFDEAERRWKTCADSGHVPSMLFLGNLYNGLGPERAPANAAFWYTQVCGQTRADPRAVADARTALGTLKPTLESSARKGDAEAAFALGGFHMNCEVDHAKAALWFELAIEKEHAGAQRSLGFLLSDGLGVPEDKPRALALWASAANAGDRYAQLNLGVAYAFGRAIAKDTEKGIALLTAAANQNMTNAMATLGDVLGGLDRDVEARAWYVKASERGHAGAMNAVAQWYRDGIGGPRDLVQAARWYWSMMATGNADGVHEVIQFARSMTESQLREAAKQAGNPALAEAFLESSGPR